MKLVYSPFDRPGTTDSINVFKSIYKSIEDVSKVGLDGADALLLWGGRDIGPSFYNQKPHPKNACFYDTAITHRDLSEWHLMKEAHRLQIPIIGICRGAQFLCVYAGGSLIQDVRGHESGHTIMTEDGRSFHMPANHHQMMDVTDTKHHLIAWALNQGLSYEGEVLGEKVVNPNIEKHIDPEIVYFESIKGLAIQPHPEWGCHDKNVDFCVECILRYCYGETHASC